MDFRLSASVRRHTEDGSENYSGGSWSLKEELFTNTEGWSRSRVFQPICYIAHGIWQNTTWDHLPWLRNSLDVRNCLRRIAFINVSKLPGLKVSLWKRISDAYQIAVNFQIARSRQSTSSTTSRVV
jgi:hypothetical protein